MVENGRMEDRSGSMRMRYKYENPSSSIG